MSSSISSSTSSSLHMKHKIASSSSSLVSTSIFCLSLVLLLLTVCQRKIFFDIGHIPLEYFLFLFLPLFVTFFCLAGWFFNFLCAWSFFRDGNSRQHSFWIFWIFKVPSGSLDCFVLVYNHGEKLNSDVVFHLQNGKRNLNILGKSPVYFLLDLANPCCHIPGT